MSGIRLIVVALALKAQLLEEWKIPMTETDWKMDFIICNGETISKS
jgi:5-formyltetrahydrofolate cyclo-ligase